MRQTANQTAVDLQVVGIAVAQQVGEIGGQTEVVQTDLDVQLMQPLNERDDGLQVAARTTVCRL